LQLIYFIRHVHGFTTIQNPSRFSLFIARIHVRKCRVKVSNIHLKVGEFMVSRVNCIGRYCVLFFSIQCVGGSVIPYRFRPYRTPNPSWSPHKYVRSSYLLAVFYYVCSAAYSNTCMSRGAENRCENECGPRYSLIWKYSVMREKKWKKRKEKKNRSPTLDIILFSFFTKPKQSAPEPHKVC